MIVRGQWPNLERALVPWIRDALADVPGIEVVTELEDPWRPPIVLIEQTPGGGGEDIELDTMIDITVYGFTRPAVLDLIGIIHPRMVALPARASVMIDRVTGGGFGFIPYANRAMKRATATYTLRTRPQ